MYIFVKLDFFPLPSQSTLHRLLDGMSSQLGLNSTALNAIAQELEGKRPSERLVVLSFEEMSIQASLIKLACKNHANCLRKSSET